MNNSTSTEAPQRFKEYFEGKDYQKSLRRRHGSERRFRFFGLSAIAVSLLLLLILMVTVTGAGYTAFEQTFVKLKITLDPERVPADDLRSADFLGLIKDSMREMFPDVSGRSEKRNLFALVSPSAGFELFEMVEEDPSLIGESIEVWLPTDDDVDQYFKGNLDMSGPVEQHRLNENQVAWLDQLENDGRIEKQFNWTLFQAGDSREPESSGILGALMGSFYTLIVTLVLSFPIGVAAAVYLEEFAPTNKITDFIEVNINNLAAVPSIVFGLLGLAVFLNFFGLPRSAPLVGGLVLTLMTLPTIIISSRAAIKAVPPSIREGALAVGSSKMQATIFHVLPLALPGILTGSIIGMAQALGETAPLLMIGMVAFIVDIPGSITDP
ncbi:MAG: DUF3333 domain-containing protein, partial [Desulfovibrio sp.]